MGEVLVLVLESLSYESGIKAAMTVMSSSILSGLSQAWY